MLGRDVNWQPGHHKRGLKYNNSLTFIFVPFIKALKDYINNSENKQKEILILKKHNRYANTRE